MQTTKVFALLLIAFAPPAQAALWDRGNGLIYDDVLNITWLQQGRLAAGSEFDDGQDTEDGYLSWDNAIAWAEDLVYGGYDDWRLPNMDINGDHAAIGGFDNGIVDCRVASETECRDNELGYLFFYNLNGSYFFGMDNPPFIDMPNTAWSSTVFAFDWAPDHSWGLGFNGDPEDVYPDPWWQIGAAGAWAVRDGDVAAVVPVPAAVWLLGSALAGLSFVRRKNSSLRQQPKQRHLRNLSEHPQNFD